MQLLFCAMSASRCFPCLINEHLPFLSLANDALYVGPRVTGYSLSFLVAEWSGRRKEGGSDDAVPGRGSGLRK